MKWKRTLLIPLRSSQQDADKTIDAVALQVASRERWHQQVNKSYELLQYLDNGHSQADLTQINHLTRVTAEFLSAQEPSFMLRNAQSDDFLCSLVTEHFQLTPQTKDLAVIACISSLRRSAATGLLTSLIDLDVRRYLRCLQLASRVERSPLSQPDLQLVQILLRMLPPRNQNLRNFCQLLEALRDNATPRTFVPLAIVRRALNVCDIRSNLKTQTYALLDHRRLSSLFGELSRLSSIVHSNTGGEAVQLLNEHYPCWAWLSLWAPKLDRIHRWEYGELTGLQKKKLGRLHDLDGPDKITHRQEALRLAEPECYEYANIYSRTVGDLELLLDLLYQAQGLGSNAVELFIYLCIDNDADNTAVSTLDTVVRTGDDLCCHGTLSLLKALNTQTSLDRQMNSLIQALPHVTRRAIPDHGNLSKGDIARRIVHLMDQAQAGFREQLETGTGEYMGMLVFEFGSAIEKASWIHQNLPVEFLTRIRQFPDRVVLDTIFDELSSRQNCQNLRFKSCLATCLGGSGNQEASTMALNSIRDELNFWRNSLDATRMEFARTLGKIQSMEYSLYTTCLTVMLKEHDLYIEEMRRRIQPNSPDTCRLFATYLEKRRGLNQLQHECWLLLLSALVKEQGPAYLSTMADSMPFDQWRDYIGALGRLVGPARASLPNDGVGLTRELLSWWDTISRNMTAVQFILERQVGLKMFRWIYFPSNPERMEFVLNLLGRFRDLNEFQRHILLALKPCGGNLEMVYDCYRATEQTTGFVMALFDHMVKRYAGSWTDHEVSAMLRIWLRDETRTDEDRNALRLFCRLLFTSMPVTLTADLAESTIQHLQIEYDNLLGQARELEATRLRLKRQDPQRVNVISQRLGVDDRAVRQRSREDIPDELVDVIETVGEAEFELAFPLTSVNSLQRLARGIPEDARLLLVRLKLSQNPGFCIHFSSADNQLAQHNLWSLRSNAEPTGTICTAAVTLFTYYLSRMLYRLMQGHTGQETGDFLDSLYPAIQKLTTTFPDNCLVCPNTMAIKLWKPAACSRQCSIGLRNAPLQVRLHNLLIDPLAADLLLTCVYAAAADGSNLDLLPGCPVPLHRLRTVVDSIPPLATLQTANNLRNLIRGQGPLGRHRENLLSWLCLKFRGFVMDAPPGFRIPSMGHAKQFLLVNSNHEQEQQFHLQPGSRSGSGAVFHGTQASRLFRILIEGLKVNSNTPFMVNGAASGAGIYCGDGMATPIMFSGSTGQSWTNSALSNMRILLGCELAGYDQLSNLNVHCVRNEEALMVRYIFLLPQNFQSPPRRHVEPALNIAFANLRACTLN